jgi:hypothetical protein
MLSTRSHILFIAFVAISLVSGQERFGKGEFGGEFEGFTIGSGEHEIIRWPQPLLLRKPEGRIVSEVRDEPLSEVLFEVRGPGDSKQIRHTKTNENGQFNLRGLKAGRYTFKATNIGFRSVVGTLIVCKGLEAHEPVVIKMLLGQ